MSRSGGRSWASSRMTTEPTMLWSLRQRLGLAANRDSKNWTEVVTIKGPSQFSEANRFWVVSLFRLQAEVVFDHVLAEDPPENIRGLLDNGGVGDDVDYPLQVVAHGVVQGKSQRGKCFAPARGHGQGKKPRRIIGLGQALVQNLLTDAVDLAPGGLGREPVKVAIQERLHLLYGGVTSSDSGPAWVHKSLGVQKISVHQAGKKESDPQRVIQTRRNPRWFCGA